MIAGRFKFDAVDLLAMIVVLIALLGLGVQLRHNTLTSDEMVYAPAGLRYIERGDVIINAEHPPLTKLIAGAATLLAHPSTEQAFTTTDQWTAGRLFWFESGNNTDQLLFLSRLPFALLTLGLLIWVYRWVGRRFGKLAGLVSLTTLALNPTIIAHGMLATNDLFLGFAAWCLVVASVWFVEQARWQRAVVWGMAIASVALAKFSGLILLPFAIIAVGLGVLVGPKATRKQQGLYVLLSGAIAIALIWVCYAYIERSVVFQAGSSLLLPLARFWQGVLDVRGHNALGHLAYLNGELSQTGFRSYFLWALWYKTPTIIGVVLFVGSMYAIWRRQLLVSVLTLTAIAFLFIASIGHIDIGVRHVLVAYVLLAPAAGYLFTVVQRQSKTMLLGVTAALLLLEVWAGGGLSFGYFSVLSGGVQSGYQHLADSNSDWGQDLSDVAQFVRERQIVQPTFAYITGEDPSYRRFQYLPLEGQTCADLVRRDWIIVSTSTVVGLHGSYPCLFERATAPTTIRIGQSYWAFRGVDL